MEEASKVNLIIFMRTSYEPECVYVFVILNKIKKGIFNLFYLTEH